MSDFDSVVAQVTALTRAQVVATAKAENAKIMETDPEPLGFVRHVDGVEGAPEESVSDGGVIVYDYNRLDMLVSVALDTLRQYSPVDKGDYVRSHTVFVGGKPVDDLTALKAADNVVIANLMPYARKIERGGKKYRTHPRVYEQAERDLNRRYGNIASINFGYFQVDIGDVADWASTTRVSSRGHASTNNREDWLKRQPALFISQR